MIKGLTKLEAPEGAQAIFMHEGVPVIEAETLRLLHGSMISLRASDAKCANNRP